MQINTLLSTPISTPELFDAARRLDGHYIPSRYPDAFPTGIPADYYHEAEASQALEDARDIVTFMIGHT